ncbi:monooxygenase FAD-binding protein [Fomes fomentarius]|nr:monooxygenase FAD-binding protein [Fomes fomentarius]
MKPRLRHEYFQIHSFKERIEPIMSSASAPQLHIVIIGGGLAGLTLLLTLHRRGIPATLYEREPSADSRAHLGGMLDLGHDSGQRALRENGLKDAFVQHSRLDAQEIRIYDAKGTLLMNRPAEPDGNPLDARPEIDRPVLRKMLLEGVPADHIKWGYTFASARPLTGGQHEIAFTNGATVVSDILVGADGGFSRVRALVSPITPTFSGRNGSEISLSPEVAASAEMQDVSEAVGQGTAAVMEGGKMFAFQRNGSGRIRAYLWHPSPFEWTTPRDPKEARKALLEIIHDWAPWMRKVVEHCDDAAIYHRPIFTLPVGHRWDHVPGVTVIGDAAHLMPPNGAGANLAMLDGLELGIVLSEVIKEGKTAEERDAAVAAWEGEMLTSIAELAEATAVMLKKSIEPDAVSEEMARKAKEYMMRPETRRKA